MDGNQSTDQCKDNMQDTKFMLFSVSARWVEREFSQSLLAIFVANLSQDDISKMEQCSIAWEGVVECKWRDFTQTARCLQHVFSKSLNQGAEVLTFEQLRYEVSRHRSSHVIIRWPCLQDGWLPKFTANNLAVTLMMSSSDDQPTTTTAPLLLKEAPVYSNKVCNDCNET